MGYSGCPLGVVPQCTDARCKAKLSYYTLVHYYFPSWLCAKALLLCINLTPLGDPSASLLIRRIVSPVAEIFSLTDADDGDGIRRLIAAGLASPMDIREDRGWTSLHVSHCLPW